jgi:hypothetical protein
MSSDLETSDCDSLASDTTINIDPEVAVDYSRGLDFVVHKGKTRQWQQHTNHARAFCNPRYYTGKKSPCGRHHRSIRFLEELVGSWAN